MAFAPIERTRTRGERVELFLVRGADPTLESLTESLAIGPGTGEYDYATTRVKRGSVPENWLPGMPSFMQNAIAEAKGIFPRLKNVVLQVAWYGSDLRMGQCRIRPKVSSTVEGDAFPWRVGPVDRAAAQTVSKPAIMGGTPADRAVYEAIVALRNAGLRVTVYPNVIMDIPYGNGLPSPYGGTGQQGYPWRGRVTCHPAPGRSGTVDKKPAAANQVDSFFGSAGTGQFGWNSGDKRVTYSGDATDWGYRRFILHLATIAAAAGANDFVIGSQLPGVTTVRDDNSNSFPAVSRLRTLAGNVRSIMGGGAKIGYAADWTEYHSHRPDDGSGDVYFHLDPLWNDSDIDFVGIDWSAPLSDWRNGRWHIDRKEGWGSAYDPDYLRANIEGGEEHDWRYKTDARREAQRRSEIIDPADTSQRWVFRQKAIREWWINDHQNRPGGNRQNGTTAWTARSKPLRMLFSYRAVELAPNGSRDTTWPPFSGKDPDDVAQRAAIEAVMDYWPRTYPAMVDQAIASYFGVRPLSAMGRLAREDYETSNSLTGRVWPGNGFLGESIEAYGFTDSEDRITRRGVTYLPVPVDRSDFADTGTLDKATINITLQRGTPLDSMFIVYPPSRGANLTIYQGHVGQDPDSPRNFPVAWTGRVLSARFTPLEIVLTAEPLQSVLMRPGLRRRYQLTCPHVLYGEDCRARRDRVLVTATVQSISGNTIRLTDPGLPEDPAMRKYAGGLIEWEVSGGGRISRTVVEMDGRRNVIVRGYVQDLAAGDTVYVLPGCNRQQNDCRALHNNILNFGGQPNIPGENPFSAKNQYY